MKLLALIMTFALLNGCAYLPAKEFSADETREWLTKALKPGDSVWLLTKEKPPKNKEFVLIEADDKGLKGKNVFVPYEMIDSIGWETEQQRKSYCKKNPKTCELIWLTGGLLIWVPFL